MKPVHIYEWVHHNNRDPKLTYGKGWWDYIEFLYRLMGVYGDERMEVVGTYELKSPLAPEVLCMPVARLTTERATFIMKITFDLVEPLWTVSVIRDSDHAMASCGLFSSDEDVALHRSDGFAPEWVFPCYAKSPARFTTTVADEWQLFAFLWVLSHAPHEYASEIVTASMDARP